MGSVVAGAGVDPADQRWSSWQPLLPPRFLLQKRFEGLVPELSLIFCAIGLNDVQAIRLVSADVGVIALAAVEESRP